jgi:hypothetical protein
MYGARSAKRTVSLTTVSSRTRLKSWKPGAAAEDAAGRRGELRLRPLLLWRVALRGPQERWKLVVAAENLTNAAFCTGVLNQPNTAAFGLNNPATGGTVLRCALNDPARLRSKPGRGSDQRGGTEG